MEALGHSQHNPADTGLNPAGVFPNIYVLMSADRAFQTEKGRRREDWYEKIKLSYSGKFQNSLTSGQDEFSRTSLIKDWRNA